jgi:hypothetical protein
MTLLFSLVAASCTSVTIDSVATCELDAVLDPPAAVHGATVNVSGGPFTIARDTQIEVGGVEAVVAFVTREGCDECDECRDLAECAPCGPCFGEELDAETRVSCFGDALLDPPVTPVCDTCVESLAFIVPDNAPTGPTTVLILNANGATPALPFEVIGPPIDTSSTAGTGDTGGTGNTGGTGDTGGTADTGDTSGTADTGGTADTSETGPLATP